MEIKLLNKNDMLHYNRLSSIAFTYSREPEKEEVKDIPENEISYGAFDGENLMAAAAASLMPAMLNGTAVKHFGVGAVATFPEYRNRGAIKAIFNKMLTDLYDKGFVLSSLMPFEHAFYRKFGYELCYFSDTYKIPLTEFCSFPKPIKVKMVLDPEEKDEFLNIYKEFIADFGVNLAIIRDKECRGTEQVWGGHFTKDKSYRYVLYNETGKADAYISFTKQNEGNILSVNECAYVSYPALKRVLGFLGGFYPHYSTASIKLPTKTALESLFKDAYKLKKEFPSNFMHRVVNVKKAAETIKTELQGSFILKINDGQIPHNNKNFEFIMNKGSVICSETEKEADGEMNITSLTQLITGAFTLDELMIRDDIIIKNKHSLISALFTKKNLYTRETF